MAAGDYTVTYTNITLTDYMSVTAVNRSILPPREVSLLEVPARHGAYFTGVRYGVRKIELEVILKATTPTAYMDTMRFIAYCLDVDQPSDLVCSDEPLKVNYAILSDSTDMDELFNKGKGKLVFICPDPFAYSLDPKTISPVSNKFTFVNDGTTTTFPKFTVDFHGDATFVSITSPEGTILVGNPSEPEQIVLPKTQYMLNDNMESTTGWASAGNVLDSGRTNTGSIGVNDVDGIAAVGYGTGTGVWHGPAVRKDLASTVQDFTMKVRMNFSSQDGTSTLDGNQKGRLEIYLFNSSGGKIGKMVMRDSYGNYEFNIPEIYIGNTTILEDEPKAPAGKKVSQKTYTTYVVKKGDTWLSIAKKFKMKDTDLASLNGKTTGSALTVGMKLKVYDKTVTKTVYPEHVGLWNDFYGEFTLQRIGTTWYAEVSRMSGDSKTPLKKTKTIKKTIYDKGLDYTQSQLSYIVIHFAQYGTDPVVQKMRVTDVKILKNNTDTVIDVPALFTNGDSLEIDLNDSSVWLNGDPFMTDVDVASEFFPVYEGTTEVQVNTNDSAAVWSAEFTERYL